MVKMETTVDISSKAGGRHKVIVSVEAQTAFTASKELKSALDYLKKYPKDDEETQ